MSVLGILLHFGRAVIQAHNNAKVRNLMDVPPPETSRDRARRVSFKPRSTHAASRGRHLSPDASEKEPGAIHPGGR